MNRNKIIAILTLCIALLMMTCAVAETTGTKVIQLGTSSYTLTIPEHFVEGGLTDKEIADDMIAYFHSPETLMDFDVYQFSKEKYDATLAEFVKKEAAEYKASEVVTDGEINGIAAAWYRAVENYKGEDFNTLTYALEDGGDYVEIAFWIDGETAEEEIQAIMNTLTLVTK
jgi:hypothetical protein